MLLFSAFSQWFQLHKLLCLKSFFMTVQHAWIQIQGPIATGRSCCLSILYIKLSHLLASSSSIFPQPPCSIPVFFLSAVSIIQRVQLFRHPMDYYLSSSVHHSPRENKNTQVGASISALAQTLPLIMFYNFRNKQRYVSVDGVSSKSFWTKNVITQLPFQGRGWSKIYQTDNYFLIETWLGQILLHQAEYPRKLISHDNGPELIRLGKAFSGARW